MSSEKLFPAKVQSIKLCGRAGMKPLNWLPSNRSIERLVRFSISTGISFVKKLLASPMNFKLVMVMIRLGMDPVIWLLAVR